MTPVMKVLRVVFFRPLGLAEDQDRRLQETDRRVDHAKRMLGNSIERFDQSSGRLREAKETIIDGEMVAMMRQLSTTLDNR